MNKVRCSESSSGSRAKRKLACFSEMQLRRRSHVSKALCRGLEHCLAPKETRPAGAAEVERRESSLAFPRCSCVDGVTLARRCAEGWSKLLIIH